MKVGDVACMAAAALDLSEWRDKTGTMSAKRILWAVITQDEASQILITI
jgi:hypothetical protein